MTAFQPLLAPGRFQAIPSPSHRTHQALDARNATRRPPAPPPRPPEASAAAPLAEPEAPAAPDPELEAERAARKAAQAERDRLQADLADAQARLQETEQRVADLAGALEHLRQEAQDEIRQSFADLLVAVVRRVLVDAPALDEPFFRGRVQAVMERLVLEGDVVVRVPTRHGDAARALLSGRPGWRVVEDESLSGGCTAECRNGRLDASREAVLDGLERAVLEWLSHDRPTEAR